MLRRWWLWPRSALARQPPDGDRAEQHAEADRIGGRDRQGFELEPARAGGVHRQLDHVDLRPDRHLPVQRSGRREEHPREMAARPVDQVGAAWRRAALEQGPDHQARRAERNRAGDQHHARGDDAQRVGFPAGRRAGPRPGSAGRRARRRPGRRRSWRPARMPPAPAGRAAAAPSRVPSPARCRCRAGPARWSPSPRTPRTGTRRPADPPRSPCRPARAVRVAAAGGGGSQAPRKARSHPASACFCAGICWINGAVRASIPRLSPARPMAPPSRFSGRLPAATGKPGIHRTQATR